MKTLDAVVAESPVFAGLDQPYLELVAGCASNIVFSAGDYLFREGDPADTFYLVRHGRVMLETFVPGRGAVTIETIDDGEVIGWSWLFPPHRWHFDARALDLVRGGRLRRRVPAQEDRHRQRSSASSCSSASRRSWSSASRPPASSSWTSMATAPDLAPMVPRPFRVKRRVRETHDTWTLSLDPVQGEQLDVAPGQFTMLYAFGVGEVPISVSAAPLVQTIRAVGPVSRALCASRPGTVVGVRGPFGTSWPVEEAKGSDLLIVAGGVGLPPVRPALLHALAHRADYGRVILLYGARTPADIVFRKEIEQWRSRMDLEVDVTVDAGDDAWRGKVGVVPTLIPRRGDRPRLDRRLRRRAGDHDALHRAGARRRGAARSTRSGSRWSAR